MVPHYTPLLIAYLDCFRVPSVLTDPICRQSEYKMSFLFIITHGLHSNIYYVYSARDCLTMPTWYG